MDNIFTKLFLCMILIKSLHNLVKYGLLYNINLTRVYIFTKVI